MDGSKVHAAMQQWWDSSILPPELLPHVRRQGDFADFI
jgi:hypothetical protein